VGWDVIGQTPTEPWGRTKKFRIFPNEDPVHKPFFTPFGRLFPPGKLWDFDCLFPASTGTVRTRADVFSASILAEVIGTKDAPVLSVRCEEGSAKSGRWGGVFFLAYT